jgi:hypothetical protein
LGIISPQHDVFCFVAILSRIFLYQQRDLAALFMVAVAFAGVWLIIDPGRVDYKTEILWGLASGISAAFGILYLNPTCVAL